MPRSGTGETLTVNRVEPTWLKTGTIRPTQDGERVERVGRGRGPGIDKYVEDRKRPAALPRSK